MQVVFNIILYDDNEKPLLVYIIACTKFENQTRHYIFQSRRLSPTQACVSERWWISKCIVGNAQMKTSQFKEVRIGKFGIKKHLGAYW